MNFLEHTRLTPELSSLLDDIRRTIRQQEEQKSHLYNFDFSAETPMRSHQEEVNQGETKGGHGRYRWERVDQ